MTGPVVRADPDLVERLRHDLTDARFSGEGLSSLWGAEADAALHRGHRVPALRALVPGRRLDTLARPFVLNLEVPRGELDLALPRLGVDGAVALGLVGPVQGGAGIRPLLDLRPYSFVDARGVGGWWILSDLGEVALGHPLSEDHVLGVGGASTTLSGLMTHSPVGVALDLGTGCGIQAMHAARHAERVVATDISSRALDIARVNALLNGFPDIEFRLGDLFEPVEGELFDQIVSNPPFVITPRIEGVPAYEYRDGGMIGDALVERVVREAPRHLTGAGTAQFLGNWEYRDVGRAGGMRGPASIAPDAEPDGLERVRRWIDASPTPVDAWVIERESQDAALYAETWIRDGGTDRGPDFDRLYGAWLDDFGARGVTTVGFGYITLRRRSSGAPGVPMRRFERLPGATGHNATGLGDHVEATLAAYAWQAERADAELLGERLVVASDITEERHYWPGAEDPTVMTLRQGGGLGRSTSLDTALAGFVGACDGDLTAGSIIAALAELLPSDEAALRTHLLPSIRELLVTGVLRTRDDG